MTNEITELCDKMEELLTDDEECLRDETGGEYQFHPETWKTWAKLREILTGRDCL
ncbi:hypothetical protein [Salinithrix halophila]|uniref:Uncharacterized protein n=1 Tax=Salinithrix halophila TaxID=1485204 RepID=A0ABV8JGZ9_9BACL